MSKSYPTGVENHGGSLRIWFIYEGRRVRENLGVADTPKNRKMAGELRASISFEIKTGRFNYAAQFPNSPNLSRFGVAERQITVSELSARWLELKKVEICSNAHGRYRSVMRNMLPRLGPSRMVSSFTKEDMMNIRRELLTGYQILKKGHTTPVKGRSVPTVNNYMGVVYGLFQFAIDGGYIKESPFNGMAPLKKSRPEPDPLTTDEFTRLIDAFRHQQVKNMWSLAVYTGLRHGELVSLAWEDIDLVQGTITVSRNHTLTNEFTFPKTEAGTDRKVYLVDAAIRVLRNQAEMTRLGATQEVEVKTREYGRSVMHQCTFVFNPKISALNGRSGNHYSVSSINQVWREALKRAGLRHRNAYQSRHTYACWSLSAGANPNFIANQMGHADAQMVYKVYGRWMADNNLDQIAILNQKLSSFAPPMPHAVGSNQ
ncbi:site-specific integrase [Yokenella regensburgei]|uniref:tyrosine-type recombinase/integrase n=1 Tax=Yokenella regensburgei TaxID=158877 RepID=UPI003F1419BD